MMAALPRTKPAQSNKYAVKRQGAKAVKQMEKVSDTYLLSPEDATMFRALSARGNYLAQDKARYQFRDEGALPRIFQTEPQLLPTSEEIGPLLDWQTQACLQV